LDENAGDPQTREMLSARLLRSARRMQRIREQEQACDQLWFFRAEHARLSASVGMPSKKYATGNCSFHRGDGILQTGAVAGGVAQSRRAVRAGLAVREIATQNGESRASKGFCKSDEQWGCGVRSCAMREHEAIAVGVLRDMEKTANSGIDGLFDEFANARFRQQNILRYRS